MTDSNSGGDARPASRRSWFRRRWKTLLGAFLVLLALGANALAFVHARAMTRFTRSGSKTARPENLSAVEKVKVLACGINVPRPVNRQTPADRGLAFSVHRYDSDDAITLEAWLVPHPESKGIVLLFHGYSDCKASLLDEAVACHELGYDAFLVDFRGSGGSTGDRTTLGFEEASDVVRSIEYVKGIADGRPVFAFGASMGAAAILRAVGRLGARPDGLILQSPFDRLLSAAESRFDLMGVPAFPFARLLVFWGGVQNGFDAFSHNPADYAAGVPTPVLLIHGACDRRISNEQTQAILAPMNGRKRLVLFPGAGHDDLCKSNPRLWRECVGRFLDQVQTRATRD